MAAYQYGRLSPATSAPATGEEVRALAQSDGLLVEEILSGRLEAPRPFSQSHAEWALVLEGRARLEVDREEVELDAGGWVWLPAGVPHTLVSAEPGTRWVAVHAAG